MLAAAALLLTSTANETRFPNDDHPNPFPKGVVREFVNAFEMYNDEIITAKKRNEGVYFQALDLWAAFSYRVWERVWEGLTATVR